MKRQLIITLLSWLLLGRNDGLAQQVPAPPEKAADLQKANSGLAKHLLRAGDVVDVQVFGEEELRMKGALEPDGTFNLALLGNVKLEGQTAEQAAGRIRELYMQDYLVDPIVSVTVTEFAKVRFTILGQVRSPGLYQYAASEKINILQAIARAGGFTRIGEPSKIFIKRVVNGKETVIRVNAKAMANDAGAALFEVHAEDTISVGETVF